MPNYVRFSDNTTNSNNNSYKVFDDNNNTNNNNNNNNTNANTNNTNEVLEQYKQSPNDLQRQQETFQQANSHNQQNSNQQSNIHSQTPLPNFNEESRNKQLELRHKQQQLQQERYQSSIPHSHVEDEEEMNPKQQNVHQSVPRDNYSQMSISDIQQIFPNSNKYLY